MLVLSRRKGESIVIGGNVRVTVVNVTGSQVKLSIDAPRSISVHRNEIWDAICRENEEALRTGLAAELGVTGADGKTTAPQPLTSMSGKGSFGKLLADKPEDGEESEASETEEGNVQYFPPYSRSHSSSVS